MQTYIILCLMSIVAVLAFLVTGFTFVGVLYLSFYMSLFRCLSSL